LLGKYRIERVLGMGGMGVVVAATHVTLEERVAIKFLLPHALSNAEAVARFLREARAAVRIKSEHVARVTDVGQLENGSPYMIMEYLDGADLGSIAHRRGALPIEDSVEYVLQACEAIAEAHALGIIHRDLKPANLFVVQRADGTPSVKVLDFGISKVAGLSASAGSGSDLGMTKTSTIMGSPLYMSPEQMASARDVDPRTDVWALGAILYELLAGKVPFQADTITQLCAMILQQPAPALRNARPDAPEALQGVIQRCLEKDRNLRYANVAEFANALAPFAPRRARISIERVTRVLETAGLGLSRPHLEEALPSSQLGGQTHGAWGGSGVGRRSTGRVLGIALALVAVAGIAAAGIYGIGRPSAPPGPPAAAKTREPEAAPVSPAAEAPAVGAVEAATGNAKATSAETPVAPSASASAKAAGLPRAARPKTASKQQAAALAAEPAAAVPTSASKPAKKVDLYNDRK
jgi:serine/threonine-protein kinase